MPTPNYRPSKPGEAFVQFTMRIPAKLDKQVRRLAKKDNISMNYMVQKLIEEALDAR